MRKLFAILALTAAPALAGGQPLTDVMWKLGCRECCVCPSGVSCARLDCRPWNPSLPRPEPAVVQGWSQRAGVVTVAFRAPHGWGPAGANIPLDGPERTVATVLDSRRVSYTGPPPPLTVTPSWWPRCGHPFRPQVTSSDLAHSPGLDEALALLAGRAEQVGLPAGWRPSDLDRQEFGVLFCGGRPAREVILSRFGSGSEPSTPTTPATPPAPTSCRLAGWTGPPLPWGREQCTVFQDASNYTSTGCCGIRFGAQVACVDHQACFGPAAPPAPRCGDGRRDAGEDCTNCPADLPAGECSTEPPVEPPPPSSSDCERLWDAVKLFCPAGSQD